MAPEPPHTCGGCGRIVTGRCQPCRTKRDRARPTSSARGYTRTWTAYSRVWLRRFPWCGQRVDGRLHPEHSRCVQEGRTEPATCTDHILAQKDGGAQFDPTNHQSLCKSCNARKAVLLEGGFGR